MYKRNQSLIYALLSIIWILISCSPDGYLQTYTNIADSGSLSEFDERIAKVQRNLNLFDARLDVDGFKGPRTILMIERFQARVGMDVDGEITDPFIRRLEKAVSDKQETEEIRAGRADPAPAKYWAFAATPVDPFHGVAIGSSPKWAKVLATKACEERRDQDRTRIVKHGCSYVRYFPFDEDACLSFIWTSTTGRKHFGVAYGIDLSSRHKDSVDQAYESCGNNPMYCKEYHMTGAKNYYSYCSEDFRQ